MLKLSKNESNLSCNKSPTSGVINIKNILVEGCNLAIKWMSEELNWFVNFEIKKKRKKNYIKKIVVDWPLFI